jgi:hypothetical protein
MSAVALVSGFTQEQYIEMLNATDIGWNPSFSETQFSANKPQVYESLETFLKVQTCMV